MHFKTSNGEGGLPWSFIGVLHSLVLFVSNYMENECVSHLRHVEDEVSIKFSCGVRYSHECSLDKTLEFPKTVR